MPHRFRSNPLVIVNRCQIRRLGLMILLGRNTEFLEEQYWLKKSWNANKDKENTPTKKPTMKQLKVLPIALKKGIARLVIDRFHSVGVVANEHLLAYGTSACPAY